jgi:hypothetical protein
LRTVVALSLTGFLLAGCAGHMPGSVMGGECKVFNDPGFAVQGARLKDKQWIGSTQEKGIDVCGWKRPKADSLRHRYVPVQASAPMPASVAEPAPVPPVVTPAPKRHWYDRFRKKQAS